MAEHQGHKPKVTSHGCLYKQLSRRQRGKSQSLTGADALKDFSLQELPSDKAEHPRQDNLEPQDLCWFSALFLRPSGQCEGFLVPEVDIRGQETRRNWKDDS